MQNGGNSLLWARRINAGFALRGMLLELACRAGDDGQVVCKTYDLIGAFQTADSNIRAVIEHLVRVGAVERLSGKGERSLRLRLCLEATPEEISEKIESDPFHTRPMRSPDTRLPPARSPDIRLPVVAAYQATSTARGFGAGVAENALDAGARMSVISHSDFVTDRRTKTKDEDPPKPPQRPSKVPDSVKVMAVRVKLGEAGDDVRGIASALSRLDKEAIDECESGVDDIVAATVSAFHREWGDKWLHDNLSVRFVVQRMPAYLSRQQHHLPFNATTNGRGTQQGYDSLAKTIARIDEITENNGRAKPR